MAKLTKYEKAILEKLFHSAIRLRDKAQCKRCGSNVRLSASHIYPKGTYQKMRYDIDNALLLCYRCHIHWWHKNPIEAWEWYTKTVDKNIQERLKLRSQYTDKTPQDWKLIKIVLEAKIKEYANE